MWYIFDAAGNVLTHFLDEKDASVMTLPLVGQYYKAACDLSAKEAEQVKAYEMKLSQKD